jgi:hypothetical protein
VRVFEREREREREGEGREREMVLIVYWEKGHGVLERVLKTNL